MRKALVKEKLMADYQARPAFQRNDYLLWINSARRQETREKRLNQMLDELQVSGTYMKMKQPASTKR